jgi:hypothetical protein
VLDDRRDALGVPDDPPVPVGRIHDRRQHRGRRAGAFVVRAQRAECRSAQQWDIPGQQDECARRAPEERFGL